MEKTLDFLKKLPKAMLENKSLTLWDRQEQLNLANFLIECSRNISKIKNINFEIKIETKNDDSYTFESIGTHIIPKFQFKEIYQLNFMDIDLLRIGEFTPTHEIDQLKSAIAIINATFAEFLLDDKIDKNLTLEQVNSEIKRSIESFPQNTKEQYLHIFESLIRATNCYILYKSTHQLFDREPDLSIFSNDKGELDESKIKNIDLEDEAYLPEINKLTYYSSIEELREAINCSITMGVFEKYQQNCVDGKEKLFICKKHSLLNNKNLLSKLNGKKLSQSGNEKQSATLEKFDKFIISKLFSELHKEKFNTISQATDSLTAMYTNDISEYIKTHMPSILSSEERIFERVKASISKNPELKKHLIKTKK
ncbi:hypothetical protein HLH10_16160 [Acinetobacter sp. ANC 4277]|uniref:hypothetical protein n=1 Tax=Acinetobacter terrae TaxID=2731247 RepID=UPI00148FEE36|nr:hypothetical protein [Acinetobacter terrae]NNG77751.1 hypothetical protein [Acinetobacter terrae]